MRGIEPMAQVDGPILLRRIRTLAAQGPSHLTDSQLIEQFVAHRDESAFTALVKRHAAMVLRICRGILRHQQDAEDACQAAFLVLARKAHTIRKQQAVSSWLHGVAYRLASRIRAQSLRRKKREKLSTAPCSTCPSDDLTLRELQVILHEELHRLPERFRAPLLLCYWEGKTRDEAADQLGLTPGAFKNRLDRARDLLGKRLTRRGFAPSAGCFTTLLLSNDGALTASGPLITKISQAAVAFAAGNKAAAALTITALAEGVIRTMTMTKVATTIVTLIFVGAMGTGIGYQVVESKQQDGQGIVQDNQPNARGVGIGAAEQQSANTEKEKAPKQKDVEKQVEQRKIQPWDVLFIRVTKVLQEQPIAGPYAVNPDGKIDFGISYGGSISIANLTLDDARTRIEKTLRNDFKDPQVKLVLAVSGAIEIRKIEIESRLMLIEKAVKDGMNEEDIQELFRITTSQPPAPAKRANNTIFLDLPEMTLLFGEKNDEESVKKRNERNKKMLEELREEMEASKRAKNESPAAKVGEYIEVLKLRLKVIELEEHDNQKALDKGRTARDFQVFDEKCKQLRKQISGWTDQMRELEMDLALRQDR